MRLLIDLPTAAGAPARRAAGQDRGGRDGDPEVREWIEKSMPEEIIKRAHREATRRPRLKRPKSRRELDDSFYERVGVAYTAAVDTDCRPPRRSRQERHAAGNRQQVDCRGAPPRPSAARATGESERLKMPTLVITTRATKNGPRYVVRYRLGGRGWPVEDGGRFRTLKEARARRDLVAGEIAAGRDPAEALRSLRERAPERNVAEWGSAMVASRLDVSEGRIAFLELALRTKINPRFGERLPREIRPPDVQEWIAEMDAKLAARSVTKYHQVLCQVLDYAETDPNAARHKSVKLPFVDVEEATPPTTEHFLAMLGRLSVRLRLPAVFLEQTAARVAELRSWEWHDVDVAGSRIRSRGVKGRRGTRRVMWRAVPPWLMEHLLESVPFDDRTDGRRLFPGLKEGTMRDSMGRACRSAGIPRYSPHDLRHRRGSLWHASGMPARELAERMGHSKASMSLDVYTHVMAPEEAAFETVSALIRP